MDLLDAARRIASPDFVGTADGIGSDATGSLTATVGPGGRVTRIAVGELDAALRREGALAAAIVAAVRAAEAGRLLTEMQHAGVLGQEGALREPFTAPTREPVLAEWVPPAEAELRYEAYFAHGIHEVGPGPSTPHWGTSSNGYLRLASDARGLVVDAEVDDAWASAVQPDRLARALAEALADALPGAQP